MPIVTFVNEKKQVQVPDGANLRTAAMQAGIQLYPFPHNIVNCHGFGQCGSCRVNIVKGKENASPKGWWEKLRMWFSMAYVGNEETMRLACRTRVGGDMQIETRPAMNLYGDNFFS